MNNSQTIRESSVKWQRPCTAKGPEWNQFKIRQNKSKMYKRKGTFVNCAFRHSVSNMINILPEIYRQFPWGLRHVITMSPARVQPGTFVALCHPSSLSTQLLSLLYCPLSKQRRSKVSKFYCCTHREQVVVFSD